MTRTQFEEHLMQYSQFPLRASGVRILQINVGRRCNLSCLHCHLEAGPHRAELMSREVLQVCLDTLRAQPAIHTIDVTGGAPEMNPHLEWFLDEAATLKRRLIVRSNLVILTEPEYSCFLDVYARVGVEVVGSLPDVQVRRFERQRGAGGFAKALQAIRALNARGYAQPGSALRLDLMHNPAGAYIPGPQKVLEQTFREKLETEHRVQFNHLLCLVNMPLGRYKAYLMHSDNYTEYCDQLVRTFNPANLSQVMCRETLSVDWTGRLFDCDFNQSLDLRVNGASEGGIRQFDAASLNTRDIVVGEHCFGCTAGAGSSCQGCFD